MIRISLFKMGISVMLALISLSCILNIISIGTTAWTEPEIAGLNSDCSLNGQYRFPCFKQASVGLIATGTALNLLAFVLVATVQVSHCLEAFRQSIVSKLLVLASTISSVLSLIFSTIGWYLILSPIYQDVIYYYFYLRLFNRMF